MLKNNAQSEKNSSSPRPLAYASQQLQSWLLDTPIGREILHTERTFFRQNVEYRFGLYSLQIGLPEINLLQGNKIANHYTIELDLKTDLHFLPFADNSIDLIICPHSLEFSNNYHHVLQELYRILTPSGHLIITCFNRYSWFGLLKKRITILKQGHLIGLTEIKNQLQALNFRLEGGKFFSYCPPLSSARQLAKYQWLNKVGDRWLPTLANSFAIIARKEKITLNLIKNLNEFKSFNPLQPNLGTAPLCNKNL